MQWNFIITDNNLNNTKHNYMKQTNSKFGRICTNNYYEGQKYFCRC